MLTKGHGKNLMNVPNTLSVLRLLLIPVFCWSFLMSSQDSMYYYIAGAALVLSALSDLLDGFFARILNQITEIGKLLDPIADKLTLGAVVVCMWIRFGTQIPILNVLFALLLLKELVMAIGGIIVFRGRRQVFPARWWGKIGTAGFYACMMGVMIVSIFFSDYQYSTAIIIGLVALSVILMLFAFVRYFILGLKLIKKEDVEEINNKTENVHDVA